MGTSLIWLCFYNSNSVWHGLDLIIEALNKHKQNNIHLFVVGEVDERIIVLANGNKNIFFTGHLKPAEYQKYLERAQVGIGSLATYRIKLKEAATLKVREYFASGLPICLGYKDGDIQQSAIFRNYTFQFETNPTQVNLDEVYTWAVDLYREKELNYHIRQEAFEQIDFSRRVKTMLAL